MWSLSCGHRICGRRILYIPISIWDERRGHWRYDYEDVDFLHLDWMQTRKKGLHNSRSLLLGMVGWGSRPWTCRLRVGGRCNLGKRCLGLWHSAGVCEVNGCLVEYGRMPLTSIGIQLFAELLLEVLEVQRLPTPIVGIWYEGLYVISYPSIEEIFELIWCQRMFFNWVVAWILDHQNMSVRAFTK